MCQCSTPAMEVVRPSVRMSVHDQGEQEAKRHKWIESEKAGRDLGESAIRCWVREHWNGFLRARWLEHLQGRTTGSSSTTTILVSCSVSFATRR